MFHKELVYLALQKVSEANELGGAQEKQVLEQSFMAWLGAVLSDKRGMDQVREQNG